MTALTCFKAYDVRGRLGVDLDEAIVMRIGHAFARVLDAKKVVVGRDVRESSAALTNALIDALILEGVEVLDLGLAGTEEMYFAVTHFGADGGVEVTASHNPIDYNGMKMVRRGSAPLDPQTELGAIKTMAESTDFSGGTATGTHRDVAVEARAAYVERVLSFVDVSALRPLKIVVNSGNGASGPTFDAIADALEAAGSPLSFVRHHHTPDSSFPNGIPNPLLIENRAATADIVRAHSADMGVAWDGDFDRCFFFDNTGRFIDGEYIVGLLAAAFLEKENGAHIVHDPRVIWNTQDIVQSAGGVAVQSKTGHAFIKQELRNCDAVYGGEMSAHHYFRDFVYCDSGMIPWLLVAELLGRRNLGLDEMIDQRRAAFPSSGEINFKLDDPKAAMARVIAAYQADAIDRDDMDGVGLSFDDWRFSLRSSNTEPVVRLNVESRGNPDLLAQKTADIEALLKGS